MKLAAKQVKKGYKEGHTPALHCRRVPHHVQDWRQWWGVSRLFHDSIAPL